MEKRLWQQIFQYILAALIAVGLYWVTYMLILKETPPENKDALLIVLGVMAAGFTSVIQYFFGSSKGSADKNDIIHKG
ncbi:unnamed protein product, partial [marine sediment metagenome]